MKPNLAIDQYGTRYRLDPKCPRASLLRQLGAKSCSRMYIDCRDGETYHVGYVVPVERGVPALWCSLYELTPFHRKI